MWRANSIGACTLFSLFLVSCGTDSSMPADGTETKVNGMNTLATDLIIDRTRRRNLATWIPDIKAYSNLHYRENTHVLRPIAIVLHYTVSATFPWNLIEEPQYGGERPGRSTHLVVDRNRIWELLPLNVRSRGSHGANHRALNIEMVALGEDDLFSKRRDTLQLTAKLVARLMSAYQIPITSVYAHSQIDRFDGSIPWVMDFVRASGSGKTDPGEKNMDFILSEASRIVDTEFPQASLAAAL